MPSGFEHEYADLQYAQRPHFGSSLSDCAVIITWIRIQISSSGCAAHPADRIFILFYQDLSLSHIRAHILLEQSKELTLNGTIHWVAEPSVP
jgi:hypothetical protein